MTLKEYVDKRVDLYIEELDRYKPQYDSKNRTRYVEVNGTYENGIPSLEEYREMISDDVQDSFSLYDIDDFDFDVESITNEEIDSLVSEAFADFESCYNDVIEMRKPYIDNL